MQRPPGLALSRRPHRRITIAGTLVILAATSLLAGLRPALADNGEVLANSPWCTNGVANDYVPPAGQALMGELLDFSTDTPASPRAAASGASARLGRTPAVFTTNVHFPFPDDATAGFLNTEADDVSHQGGILSLTLDLDDGNGASFITPAAASALADQLRTFNTVEGVPVLLRIGPEMNGSWDPWGQRPTTYVTAFRTIAAAVHQDPAVQTVWAPNYGGGAPWTGGQYSVQKSAPDGSETADFTALDTNGDGKLTQADDPYSPYWPGPEYVDWVGLSLYDFGNSYPWGPNDLPQADRVSDDITGNFLDKADHIDETAVPNFYDSYSTAYDKPFMLAETGIWWSASDSTTGNTETDVKTAWWQQIAAAQAQFPNLKAVTFFDVAKPETADVNKPPVTVSWPIDDSPAVSAAFLATASTGMVYATGHACLNPPPVYYTAPPITYAAPAPLSAPPAARPVVVAKAQKLVTRCLTTRKRVRVAGHYTYRNVRTCSRVPAPIRRCAEVKRTVRVNGRLVSHKVRVCTLYWPPRKK